MVFNNNAGEAFLSKLKVKYGFFEIVKTQMIPLNPVMELYNYSDKILVYSKEIQGKAILIGLSKNLKVDKQYNLDINIEQALSFDRFIICRNANSIFIVDNLSFKVLSEILIANQDIFLDRGTHDDLYIKSKDDNQTYKLFLTGDDPKAIPENLMFRPGFYTRYISKT